jgi:membrane fusion protein (multidrug efflux system)
MKRLVIIFTLFGMVFSACGGNKTNTTPKDAAEARKLIGDKKNTLKQIETEIAELEQLLAKLDTTTKVEKKVLVTIQNLAKKPFFHYVEVQANVATAEDPALASSETGGRIVELKVKEGDYVQKGELIAKVNLESIQKSIDELSKSMELAQDIFQRQEKLWKQNIGSEVQYLQSKNQVESLQKTKERLEFELKKADVFAPASGTVEMVMLKSGEMCGPGSPIVQILNSSSLKIVANVPEIYLPVIKRGDALKVTFPALGKEQTARVSAIGRLINPGNRTFEVEATVSNEGGLVKPNLLATVFIQDYAQKEAIVVPAELLMQDVSGQNFLMVKSGDKAAKKIVTIGKSYQNETEVLSGLVGDEQILLKGARQATEGDILQVVTE